MRREVNVSLQLTERGQLVFGALGGVLVLAAIWGFSQRNG